jgi:membrane protein
MDLLAPLRTFDRVQQTHRFIAIPIAVAKKFSDDHAGSLAALISYYAFFSIFPLLLVFVTVLGFVFQGDASVQKSITNSVLGHFPIVGSDLESKQLHGRALSLGIGLAASLWAGLGVTRAAQNAFDTVWAVPLKERPDFLRSRLRGLALVVSLGVLFAVSSLASGLVTGGLGGPALKIAGILLSLLLNLGLFAAAFRLLTAAAVPTRSLWPGVLLASVLWEILQIVGGVYVDHVVRNASNTYGTFATVIGLLAWLHVGAQMTLYAAEINVVLVRGLWPRSLLAPELPTDHKTLAALAKVEERSEREKIDVHFDAVKTDDQAPRA